MSELHLLLIEDNDDHVELFRANLSETKYRGSHLQVRSRLEAGLAALDEDRYDLVFLDLSLPDSGIRETMDRLSDFTARAPVVVTTSLDRGPDMLELISRGAQDCVPKIELRPPLLERVIRFALDRFEQTAFSQSVLQAVPDAMLYVDAQARILGGNSALGELLGHPTRDLQGRALSQVCPPALAEPIRHALGDDEEPRASEVEVVGGDGARREGILHMRQIAPDRGVGAGLVATFVDLTESRRLERELRNEQERRFQSLTVLAGGVAHDFNNSLMVILGHAELVRDDAEPGSPLHAAMEDVQAAARASAERVQHLLAYSGQVHRGRDPVELGALVREVLAGLGRDYPPGVRIVHVETRPAIAWADLQHLSLVARGLLWNAIEAVGGGEGRVEIESDLRDLDAAALGGTSLPPGRYAVLEVRDDGCGMDPETLARATEPFFTTKTMGRGLGLAAANGVVLRHDGALQLTSAPGRGTTARVLLPSEALD